MAADEERYRSVEDIMAALAEKPDVVVLAAAAIARWAGTKNQK